ncbi:hypothetical protein BH18CHL2_BH18CHL2_12910 [soil metagenome]
MAHAGQLIARGADPYGTAPAGTFVSANYPPLAYLFAAAGAGLGPFSGLRLANILASLALAALVAWRARASPPVAIALGGSSLALMPVALWNGAGRVDPLAVTLTAYAVHCAGAGWPRAAAAGILGALAMYAKPTAALPLLAVLAYFAWRERATAARTTAAFGAAAVSLAAISLLRFDGAGLYRHLVVYNDFPYDAANPALLLLLGALTLGGFAAVGFVAGEGRMRAYLLGALAVVALAGHEGATINYLLDACAASCLALAPLARLRAPRAAAVFAGQLVATLALITIGPLARPELAVHAERVGAATGLDRARPQLAEDSGVLIAAGIEPEIDDLFVWARLVALGVIPDDVTPRVRAGTFGAGIADVPLDALASAPAFVRQRWPPALVAAVLERYDLDRSGPGSYRYVPRAR